MNATVFQRIVNHKRFWSSFLLSGKSSLFYNPKNMKNIKQQKEKPVEIPKTQYILNLLIYPSFLFPFYRGGVEMSKNMDHFFKLDTPS